MTGYKGQTSLEYLLILAIGIVIVTAFILISQSQVSEINIVKAQNDAQNSVLDLSAAAKEVYAQGEGARKQVYIVIPSSYDPSHSSIANSTIRLRAAGTDYASVEDFNVYGSLPQTSGGQWVWVISQGNRVSIGAAMLSLSKNSIYVVMNPSTNATASLIATSLWNNTLTVQPIIIWNNNDVTLGYAPSASFMLPVGQSQNETLAFTASSNATGFYSGELDFTATDGSNNETDKVPVTIQIGTQYIPTNQPPLNVSPDFWSANLMPGNSTNQAFTVCTNNVTSLSGVTFTPSSGAPGSWVGGITPLGAMGAGTCQVENLNLSVPNGTAPGAYQGSIALAGQGASNAQAAITVYIVVSQSGPSSNSSSVSNLGAGVCPVGSQYQGPPLCDCQISTVYVQNGTIHGGPNDGQAYAGTLLSNANNQIITGPASGNNYISVQGTGNNYICSYGTDVVNISGGGNNVVILGSGSDTVIATNGAHNNNIYGGGGNNIINISGNNNQVDGGSGANTITGNGNSNIIFGGNGNDNINVNGGTNNIICGVGGTNMINVTGSGSNTVIDGGIGSTSVYGASSHNVDCYRVQSVSLSCTMHSGYYSTCGSD